MPAKKISVPFHYHAIFWLGVSCLLLGFIYVFQSVLLPFVLGIAVAYLIDPLVERALKYKVPRWAAALAVLGGFCLLVVALLVLLVPVLYHELSNFIDTLPQLVAKIRSTLEPAMERLHGVLGAEFDVLTILKENAATGAKAGKAVLGGLIESGQAAVGFFTVLILTPIVAFFMIIDWPKMKNFVQGLMPKAHKKTIHGLLDDMDEKISGFVRGQLTICVVLGLIYGVALTIAGLDYGFLIGLLSGALSIIPMIGSIIGLLVSVLVAWFQAGDIAYVGIIAAIFVAGQLFEGNVLTPKIMGEQVGLHPLWIIFALMAGGTLLGITGMLLAVPLTACIGVLCLFAIQQYKSSAYYKG